MTPQKDPLPPTKPSCHIPGHPAYIHDCSVSERVQRLYADTDLAARPTRPHEALVQIRSRLREEDAVTYVPMNILADVDQIICEVGGLRDDE